MTVQDYNKSQKTIRVRDCLLQLFFILLCAAGTVYSVEYSDKDIVNAIESDYIFDNLIHFNNIDVGCEEGIVTLKGMAETIREKERAEKIAGTIVGVRGIVNLINVRAVDRSDRELKKAVVNALLRDPATESYEVDVSVKQGAVTLEGMVQSWQEKRLCKKVAENVKGVRTVENKILVNYTSDRPDGEIKKEIEERLANDVRVDDMMIDVAVKDGNVTLSGWVGSLAEKNRALRDAYVAGTKDVDFTKLEIDWWARNKMKRTNYYVDRSDKEIKKAVKDAFLYDPRIFSFEPQVRVVGGIVILSGIVDNVGAKVAAEKDAENVTGVLRVRNRLKVRPKPILGNNDLLEKVTTALSIDPFVDRYDLSVDAYAGFVTLDGDVNSSFEKNRAETVVSRVKGVAGIVNNIDYQYKWEWMPDWEIKLNVEDQLYWDAMLNQEDIEIDVTNGIVTLTGTVDTWVEWNDAEKNAYEGGAKDVINNLVIRFG